MSECLSSCLKNARDAELLPSIRALTSQFQRISKLQHKNTIKALNGLQVNTHIINLKHEAAKDRHIE